MLIRPAIRLTRASARNNPKTVPIHRFRWVGVGAGVVEPPVSPIPPEVEVNGVLSPGLRDPDVLYVDEVDIEDRMFILNFALGGTRNLERFREELADSVRPVQAGEGVVVQA